MLQKINLSVWLTLLSTCADQPFVQKIVIEEDSFLWLEEIGGKNAIDWVKARNKKSLDVIKAYPKFEALYANNKTINNSNEQIPYGSQVNGYLYNFWRNETHVRGLYRRTTLAEYKNNEPKWESVLDVDALAEADNENWVYKAKSNYKILNITKYKIT